MEPSFSPDRTVRVDWSIDTGRMSHEIVMPTIVWAATNERILDMGSDWDGNLQWHGSGNAFSINYRRYAQGGCVNVWVDPTRGIFRLGAEREGPEEPLATIHQRLQQEIARTTPGGTIHSPTIPNPSPIKAFFIVMGIVVGTFLVIGFVAWKIDSQRPRQKLTAPPTPPRLMPTPTPIDMNKYLREVRERTQPRKAEETPAPQKPDR